MGVVPANRPDLGKDRPEDGNMETRKVSPRKGGKMKNKFGAPKKGLHHRSVLEGVKKWTKDGLPSEKPG